MPTIAEIQGGNALATVKQRLGTQAAVMGAINALPRGPNDGMDFSSCALTANIVIQAIFGIKTGKTVAVFPMDPADRVGKVRQLLEQDHILYVSISPDHHFVVIPIGNDEVSVVQAFQGVYRLDEWLSNSGDGRMTLSRFVNSLGNLTRLTAGAPARQEAAVTLFAYAGKEADIRSYFTGRVEVKVVQYYRLAGGGLMGCCAIM